MNRATHAPNAHKHRAGVHGGFRFVNAKRG
jgi:hypothetical protein